VALFGWLTFTILSNFTQVESISFHLSANQISTFKQLAQYEIRYSEYKEINNIESEIKLAQIEINLSKEVKKQKALVKNKKQERRVEVKIVETKAFDFSLDLESYQENIQLSYKPIQVAYVDFKVGQEKEILIAQAEPAKEIKKELEEIDDKLLIIEDDELLKTEDMKIKEQDEVKTSMSKSISQPEVTNQDDKLIEELDLQTYEYSNNKETAKVAESKDKNIMPGAFVLPNSAKKEEISLNIKNEIKPENTIASNQQVEKNEYSSAIETSQEANGFMSSQSVNTQIQITGLGFNLNKGIRTELADLDLKNVYDTGSYLVQTKKNTFELNTNNQILLVEKDGHIPTLLTITEEQEYKIPLLEKEKFEEFLLNEKLDLNGGFLLVKIDENIVDINLDKPEEKKYYLDQNLKIINKNDQAKFVLLANVEQGNRLCQLTKKDNKNVTYIIQILQDTLSYDESLIIDEKNVTLELVSEELMGKSSKALNLDSEMVTSLNTNQKALKLNLNSYKFDSVLRKEDQKMYFDINTENYPVFVGVKSSSRLIIPSLSYRNDVMTQLNLNDETLKNSCIVQINVKNKIDNAKISYLGENGIEQSDILALDKDGSWGTDVNDTTMKIFLVKDMVGTFNVELNYTNNTQDRFQTYCSIGSYLIEHL
jgi:hypothetical protein